MVVETEVLVRHLTHIERRGRCGFGMKYEFQCIPLTYAMY